MAGWFPFGQKAHPGPAARAKGRAKKPATGRQLYERRLNPRIEPTDSRFKTIENDFQRLIDNLKDGNNIDTIISQNFTKFEEKLVYFASGTKNAKLIDAQEKNRIKFEELCAGRFFGKRISDATRLAMMWFGLPVGPWLYDPAGDPSHDRAAPIAEAELGALAFLDERRDDRHLHQGRESLSLPDISGVAVSTAAVPEKQIPLYGYQGVVKFDIYNQKSLIDAVVRLVGPTRRVNLALYNTRENSRQTVLADIVHRDYCHGQIRDTFAHGNAQDELAVFAYAQDQPPVDQWEPYESEIGTPLPGSGNIVARCFRHGAGSDSDVAYLRLPANASKLGWNQYLDWMLVVARILTPGSGLRALQLDDARVVAHSFIGLHSSLHAELKTHGGLGFSQWSWDEIVDGVREGQYPVFDVVPLDRSAVSVHVPGINQAFSDNEQPAPVPVLVKFQDDPKKSLTEHIQALLESAITDKEREQLEGIDIWRDGSFLNAESQPIGSPWPCLLRSSDFGPDTGFASGVVAVQPIYRQYTAHFSLSQRMQFTLNDSLEEFREKMHTAGMKRLAKGYFRIQQYDAERVRPARVRQGKMADDIRILNNRLEFVLTPKTTEHEWIVITTQIMGPEIWCVEETNDCMVKEIDNTTKGWGYRKEYQCLQPARTHLEKANEKGPALDENTHGQSGGHFSDPQKKKRRSYLDPVSIFNDDGTFNSAVDAPPLETFLRGGQAYFPFSVSRAVLTPSEVRQMGLAMLDLHNLALQRVIKCPYRGCSSWYDTTNDAAVQKHLRDAHQLQTCNLCDKIFSPTATRADKITHVEEHMNTDRREPAAIEAAGASLPRTHRPGIRRPLKARAAVRETPVPLPAIGRQKAPLRRFSQAESPAEASEASTEIIDAPEYGPEASSHVRRGGDSAKRKRSGLPKDRHDELDDEELDQGSNPFRKKRRRAGFRGSVDRDLPYRPGQDVDDESSGVDLSDDMSGPAIPKPRPLGRTSGGGHGGLDLSYRPGRNREPDYTDDQDEELRRSAAPETYQDPLDPAGKRKQVLRESPAPAVPKDKPSKGAGRRKTSRDQEKEGPVATEKPATKKTTKTPETAARTSKVSKAKTPKTAKTATKRAARPRKTSATAQPSGVTKVKTSATALSRQGSERTSSEEPRRSTRKRQPPRWP